MPAEIKTIYFRYPSHVGIEPVEFYSRRSERVHVGGADLTISMVSYVVPAPVVNEICTEERNSEIRFLWVPGTSRLSRMIMWGTAETIGADTA